VKTNENQKDQKSGKTKKKLRLSKETLRTLSEAELHDVVGGVATKIHCIAETTV